MKCELKQAKEYQVCFKNNLIFTGFENGDIQWLGNDSDREKAKEELEDNDDLVGDKIRMEYQDNMRDEIYEEYNENLGD